MKDLKDEIIIKLLKEVEELKEMQKISKNNEKLFSELYDKLGGSAKFREINTNSYCETFPDRFLILVEDYIINKKG